MNRLTKLQQTRFIELCLLFQVSYSYSEWLEICWKILNKMNHKFKWSPVLVLEEVNAFGLICFNDFNNIHPIDYLYGVYLKYDKIHN